MLRIGRAILIFYLGINYAYVKLGFEVETLKWLLLISLLVFTNILIMFNENKINVKIRKINVDDE